MVGATASNEVGSWPDQRPSGLSAWSRKRVPARKTAYSFGSISTTLAMICAASAGLARMKACTSYQARTMPMKSLRLAGSFSALSCATNRSGIMPGRSLEVNKALPLPLAPMRAIHGFHHCGVHAAGHEGGGRIAGGKVDHLRPSASRPWRLSATVSRKCETLNSSSAIFLPFRSANDLMRGPTMMASLPAELSLTRIAFSGTPLASGAIVSLHVCELASSWPADSAAIESV